MRLQCRAPPDRAVREDVVLRDRESDPMTTLRVGIAGYEELKARTMAMARAERRLASNEQR